MPLRIALGIAVAVPVAGVFALPQLRDLWVRYEDPAGTFTLASAQEVARAEVERGRPMGHGSGAPSSPSHRGHDRIPQHHPS